MEIITNEVYSATTARDVVVEVDEEEILFNVIHHDYGNIITPDIDITPTSTGKWNKLSRDKKDEVKDFIRDNI